MKTQKPKIMATKQYEVQVYYSTYVTHYVTAETEDEAVEKARRLPVQEGEVMEHLEAWEEADEVNEIIRNTVEIM